MLRTLHILAMLLMTAMGFILSSCNDLSVIVPPRAPPSLEKISSLTLNDRGLLEMEWQARAKAPKSIYQIYLLELPTDDSTHNFSELSITSHPLKSEEITVPPEESPGKKGVLINAASDLKYAFKEPFKPERRYLLQMVEKNRTLPRGKVKAILLEVKFDNYAATSATAINDSVELNWAEIPGANRYEVYADKDLTILLGSTETTSISLPIKDGQVPKEFYVRAFRGILAAPDAVVINLDLSNVKIEKVSSTTPNGKYTVGKQIDFEVEFSDKVNVFGTSTLPLLTNEKTRNAEYVSGNGTKLFRYRYIVQAGDGTEHLKNGTILTGEFVDATDLNVSGVLPEMGANRSVQEINSIAIDTLAPTPPASVAFSSATSKTGDFDVTWDESTDLYLKDHKLKLCAAADCTSSCSTPLTVVGNSKGFSGVASGDYYACVQGEDTTGLLSAWVSSAAPLSIDKVAPVVTRVLSVSSDGKYKEPQVVNLSLEFSENVLVNLGPQLSLKLETGSVDRDAVYSSGSGTNTLSFTYTVQAGDTSTDLNYQSISALTVGSGSIRDAAGNDATLGLPAFLDAQSLASQSSIIIDTTLPTSPSAVSFASATSATTSFPVTWTNSTDTNFKQHNLKLCLSNDCMSGCTGESSSSASPATMTGADFTHYYACVQGEDLLGHVSPWVASSSTIHVDSSLPTILQVSSSTPNGAYKEGDTINLLVQFSEAVNVTAGGSLRLDLETGTSDYSAPYISGNGTDTLSFRYIVQPGDVSADLNYLSTAALSLNGASIKDASGLNADLTLPVLAGVNSLGSRQAIAIDSSDPTAPSNVVFPSAATNSLSLGFSWTASTDPHFAHHNIKLCAASDCVSTCSAVTTALGNSASLAGVNGNSYYACVQGEDSLGHTSAWVSSAASITVDTTAATVTQVTVTEANGIYKTSDILTVHVQFSESVSVANAGDLSLLLETGALDRAATYSSGSGSNTLVFTYTVQTGDTASDLDYQSPTALSKGASGSIKDAAGNDATLTLPALAGASSIAGQKALIVDTTPPTNPSAVGFSTSLTNALTFDLSWLASTDSNFTTHSVKLCSSSDCSTGCLAPLTSTASPKQMTGVNGSSYYGCVQGQDAAGLTSSWVSSLATIAVDSTAPTVTNVSSAKANGSYSIGETIDISVLFSEIVVVTTPAQLNLLLETGGTDHNAVYLSGSNSNTLLFRYTVQAGDATSDLDYKATTSLSVGTGAIKDLAGTDANINLPALAGAASLGGQKSLSIDTSSPAAPLIVTPADSSFVTSAVSVVSGTSEAGASIELKSGSTTIGTTTASGTSWSITLSTPLSDGLYSLTAKASDAAGNISPASSAQSFTVDTSAPNPPVIAALTTPTLDTTPTIAGTAEAGMSIKVYADAALVGTTTADGSGNWTLDSSVLAEGSYTVTATATDIGARVSAPSAGRALSVDGTAPSAPSAIVFPASPISNSTTLAMNWTNSTDPNFSHHNIKICTSNDCATGCTAPASDVASPASILGADTVTYYGCVQGEDLLGLKSAWIPSAATVNVDSTEATVSSVSSSTTDGIYKVGDTLAFTVLFSKPIFVSNGGDISLLLETGASDHSASFVSSSGSSINFSYVVQAGDTAADLDYASTSALVLGASGLIKDAANSPAAIILPPLAGASSIAGQKAIELDTTAPTAPSAVGFSGSYATSTTFNMSWSNSTDSNFSTHNVKICTANDCSTGCTSASTSTASPKSMTGVNGTVYYGCAQGQDSVGQLSAWVPSLSTITVDTSAPTVVNVSSSKADGSYKAGVSVTLLVQFSESVLVTNGSDLHLLLETGTPDREAVYAGGSGTDTLTFDYTVQPGDTSSDLDIQGTGALSITPAGTIKDSAGTAAVLTLPTVGGVASIAGQKAIVIDTTAPLAPVISVPADNHYSTSNVSVVSGTSESGASIELKSAGVTIGTTTAIGTAWSITLGTALSDGSYSLSALASDAAGNVSPASSSHALIVDTSAPNAPVVSALTTPTLDTTPTLSGTSEPDMTIKVYADVTLVATTTANGSGNWTVASDLLADGSYSITATATDAGARTSGASAAVPLNVDTTAPANPTGVAFGSNYSTSTSVVFTWVNSTDVNFLTHSIKLCTDSGCSVACTSVSTDTASPATLIGLSGSSYYACVQGEDSLAHTSSWIASATPATIDTTVPSISNVTTSTADGFYKTGDVIAVTATFSELVNVTTPAALGLQLETGTNDRTAVYSSGSGSTVLTFNYTVQAGDTAADLDYLSTTALTVGAGAIKDAAGNDANLTLPTVGGASSIAGQKALVVDSESPTDPSSVGFAGSTSTSTSFAMSWSLSTDSNFSTHNVKICTASDCSTGCTSASTSTASPKAMTGVNGTTYYGCVQGQDLAGLTSNWVSSASSILVDTSAPTVAGVSSTQADGSFKAGVVLPITVLFSENVFVTNGGDLNLVLETGTPDQSAVYTSGSGTNTLTFEYTVQAGDVSADLNYASTSALSLGSTGLIKDASGNAATLTLPALAAATSLATQKALVIDTTDPVAPVISVPANAAYVTSDVTTVSGTSEANAVINVIKGGVTIGTATAIGTNWSVTLGSALSDGSHTITATATDAAGNLGLASTASTFTVDTSAPNAPVITVAVTPTLDTTPPISGTSEANMAISLFADGVAAGTTTADASGNWSLSLSTLSDGTYTLTAKATDPGSRVSAASAGVPLNIDTSNPTAPASIVFTTAYSTTTSLSFSWTDSTDANFSTHNVKLCTNAGCSTACVGATTDTASPATLSGLNGSSYYACVQGLDSLGHSTAWIASAATGTVDTSIPSISNVTASSADGFYKTGDVIAVTVTFSELVNVTTPAALGLQLETGTNDRIAAYSSGSGSTVLTFNYTVQAADTAADLDYLSTTALTVGAGAIKDVAGNDANLTLPALGGGNSIATQKAIIVDTSVPTNPSSVGFAGASSTSTTFSMSWSLSTDTNFSTHNVKICTASDCSTGCTSASTSTTSPKTMTGVNGTTYYGCVQGQDLAGLTSSWVSSASTILVDTSAPTVAGVSSTQADGSFKAGVVLPITVLFSENVIVTNGGDLSLALETGTPDQSAVYTSGSGTNTLTFEYTVQAGDVSADLNYISTSALSLGSTGLIKDASGNAATLTLPALGAGTSLATQKALVIDTAAPAAPVISVPANAAYSTANVTVISGTCESGATISVIKGGSSIGSTTASGTSWSVTLGSALTDGSHTITATATDAAGNLGPASTANTFTVDTSGPNAPVITTVTSPNASTTPTVSGTSEANMAISLYADGSATGTTSADGSGNWTLALNALLEGTYSLTAKATDPGSRVSAASAGVTQKVDTSSPSNPAAVTFTSAYSTTTSLSFSWTDSTDLNFSTHNVKLCTNAGCSTACVGSSTDTASPATLTGSAGVNYYACVQGLDAVGRTSSWIASAATALIDTTIPTVTNVSSSTTDGYFKTGDVIAVTATFSELVNVTTPGALGLQLETGTNDRVAAYSSGSGSTVLTFNYTVQATDTAADLDYLSTSALTVGAGAIKDAAGNDANLTLPTVGGVNSIAGQKALKVDTTSPANPSSVGFTGSTSTSTSFNMSWSLSTDTNFSTHNVKICTANDCSTGCTSASTSATSPKSMTGVNGTTYYGCVQGQDLAGLTSSWVASLATMTVDTTVPTVSAVSSTTTNGSYKAGQSIAILILFSEAVHVTNGADLGLLMETGTTDRTATYTSGTGTDTLTFTYTVQAGDTSSDLNYQSTAALTLGATGTIRDAAGNNLTLTLPALAGGQSLAGSKALIIDTAAPAAPVISVPANAAYSTTNVTVISGTSESGAAISVIKAGSSIGTTTASGTNWSVTLGSALSDGSHSLTATATDAAGNVSSASSANVFTVDTSAPTAPVITTAATPTNDTTPLIAGTSEANMTINLFANGSAAGSTTADGSGNWTLSLNTLSAGSYTITATATDPGSRVSAASSGAPIVIDTTLPTVSSVNSSTANATYGIGATISVTVNFSEAVTVTGTPQIQLEAGASDPQATYVSGTGTTALVFQFTVASGHTSADLDYVSTTSLTGTIKDAAGNSATLTLATPGAANSLRANKAIVVDGVPAVISNLTSTQSDGAYGPGNTIDVQVTFSKAVTVGASAAPFLVLNTAPSRNAYYASGSGTTVLTFNYLIGAGEIQADLNATTLTLNGNTIRDSIGNDATLTLPASQATGSLNLNKALQIAGNSVVPVLSSTPSSQNAYTGSAISSVNTNAVGATDLDADGQAVTYVCRFDITVNSAMDSGGTDCASLPNTAFAFNASTGVMTWTPDPSAITDVAAIKTYEFRITGTDTTHLSGNVYFTVSLIKPFTSNIAFDAGTSGSYTFDSNLIDFSGGYARLLALDQSDDDDSGFSGGTRVGSSWDNTSNAYMKLNNYGSCDGRSLNCFASTAADWVPQVGSRVAVYNFDSGYTGWTASNGAVSTTTATKKLGTGSLVLNGTSNHLYRAQQAVDSFTYNFWMKSTQAFNGGSSCYNFWEGASILTSESGGTVNDWGISFCDGWLMAGTGSPDTSIWGLAKINDNVWHMVTFTRVKATGVITVYVDGILQMTATGGTNTLNTNANYNIGATTSAGYYFAGNLDELAVWSTALTEAEVARLYARQSSIFSGSFASRVMDTGTASSTWSSLNWKTTLPFGKELPDYSGGVQHETSTDYSSLNTNTLMTNITGLWHFNETSLGTAPGAKDFVDDSGNGLHGVKVNAMNIAKPGRFDKAAEFTGGGAISLGSPAALSFPSNFTVSVWFKTQENVGRIFSTGSWSDTSGVLIETNNKQLVFAIGCSSMGLSNCANIRTNATFAEGAWHNAVVMWEKTSNKARIYVDGKLQNISAAGGTCGTVVNSELDTSACPNLNANQSATVYIGSWDATSWTFKGLIDELAIWKRALSATEAKELYRRGANRLLFQVRSCAATNCAGEIWRGPDGTNQTYFTELNNNTSALNGTGTVKTTSPVMTFSDFASLGVTAKRYFQYQYIIEGDDTNAQCFYGSAENCSPELKSVEVGSPHYPLTNPSIVYTVSIPFYTIAGLTETVTCPAGTKYQLSLNNSTWYYLNGTTWTVSNGTLAQSSTAAAITTNAATFDNSVGRTTLYVKALLPSNGAQQCELDNLAISGNSAY